MAESETLDVSTQIEQFNRTATRFGAALTSSGRSKVERRLEVDIKSLAQRMAREAVEPVSDRKDRAEVKAVVFKQLVPVLELHADHARHLHRVYRRIIVGLAAGLVVLGSVVILVV